MNKYNINIKVETLADVYKKLGKVILNQKQITCRGMKTKEIIAPKIVITNPEHKLVYNGNRRFSLMFAIAESLLLVDKTNKLKYFTFYNKEIAKFSDDRDTMFGSYGFRIADYIPEIINRLTSDNNTRQANLPILRASDLHVETKDLPCTASLNFILRDNKLYLIATMRSNDMIHGLQYDMFNFTMLQETIANTLNVRLGLYIHQPTSLHVYDYHYDLLDKMQVNSKSNKIYHNMDYSTHVKTANFFKDVVDNKVVNCNTINMLTESIRAEELYKKNQLQSDNLLMIPEAFKPFTKRWFKQALEGVGEC